MTKHFFLKEGTPILVAKRMFDGSLEVKPKKTKRDVLYFQSDVEFSPDSEVTCPSERNLALQGFFAFTLPKNKAGYTTLMCHESHFEWIFQQRHLIDVFLYIIKKGEFEVDDSKLTCNCKMVPCDQFKIERNYANNLTFSIQSANIEYSVVLDREQLSKVHREIGKFLHNTQ